MSGAVTVVEPARRDDVHARPARGAAGAREPAASPADAGSFPRGNGAPSAASGESRPPAGPPGYSDRVRPRVFAIAAVAGVLGAARRARPGEADRADRRRHDHRRRRAHGQRRRARLPSPSRSSGTASTRQRSTPAAPPGVVTLYADLGADGQSQGSGFVVDAQGHDPDERPRRHQRRRRRAAPACMGPTSSTSSSGIATGCRHGSSAGICSATSAVVRVDPRAHALSPVPLGTSSSVVVGTPVAAIGSPFNEQSSLSVGVVSATDRTIDSLTSGYSVSDAIQTDAPINRGNSGGPLFDAGGRVIGINAQIRSTSGTAEGVGFAIPIDTARRALEQLLRTGKVSYAYIGVTTAGRHPGPGAEVRVRHPPRCARRQGRARHARRTRGASWRHAYVGVQRPRRSPSAVT